MGMRQIIALDLGKFKTVACIMQTADRTWRGTVPHSGQRPGEARRSYPHSRHWPARRRRVSVPKRRRTTHHSGTTPV